MFQAMTLYINSILFDWDYSWVSIYISLFIYVLYIYWSIDLSFIFTIFYVNYIIIYEFEKNILC